MPYRTLHIPFAQGQHEGFDEKLLPNGLFRSVNNFLLERDGRYARRKRLTAKSLVEPDGDVVSPNFIGFSEPNSSVTQDGSTRAVGLRQWSAGTTEKLRLVPGRASTTRSVQNYYAAQDNINSNDSLVSGWEPQGTANQTYPQADTDVNGNVLIAYNQAGNIVTELRNPDTMETIYRWEEELNLGAGGSCVIRMVASKSSAKYSLIIKTKIPVTPLYQLYVLTYRTEGDMGAVNDGATESVISTSSSDFSNSYDAIARPDEDSFLLAYQDSSGGDFYLDEFLFDQDYTSGASVSHDTVATASPISGYAEAAFTVNCEVKTGRWYWGIQGVDLGGAEPTVRSDSWGGAAPQSQTFSESESAPIMQSMGGDKTLVLTNALTSSDTSLPRLQARIWDHATDTVSTLGTFDYTHTAPPVATTQGWNQALALGYPVIDGTGSSSVARFPVSIAWSSVVRYNDAVDPGYLVSLDLSTGNMWVDTYLHRAGIEQRNWDGSGWNRGYLVGLLWRPAIFESNGKSAALWPAQRDLGRSEVSGDGTQVPVYQAVWSKTVGEDADGVELRKGEALVPGGALHFFDGDRLALAGFMGPPLIDVDVQEVNAVALADNLEFSYCAVAEYTDANGRLWRSPVSDIDTVSWGVPSNPAWDFGYTIVVTAPAGLPGQEEGAQIAVYTTDTTASGSNALPLYRRNVYPIGQGKRFKDMPDNVDRTLYSLDDAPVGTAQIYTATGEVGNDPPPCCEMLAATRSRVWAAGLPERSWIQASKPLNDIQGVHWSNLDSFKIFMPDEVTGIAAMDDSLVAFTRDKVYAIHGVGPDSAGVGVFTEPQLIPGSSGSISHLSVISTEMGVFYQSVRGIELVPRGFASSQWAGQAVRDTLESFPVCRGVCESPVDKTIRWLFNNEADDDSRVIVFDLRAQAWATLDYSGRFESIGACIGKDGDPQHTAMFLSKNGESFVEDRTRGYEALSADDAWLETGSIRVGGLQGWGYGHRATVLGEYGGRPCTVTMEFAFNDADYLPEDTYTWDLEEEGFIEGKVELELTLPVQQFSSVQFKLKVNAKNDNTDDKFTYTMSGMTVTYTPAAGQPRMAARSKG